MKKFIPFLLFLAVGLFLSGQPQPANDICLSAEIITVADGNCQFIEYSNADWTSDNISTIGQNCAAASQNDFWFKFTAPTYGSVVIRFGSIPDTEMSLTVRPGNCNQDVIAVFCSVFDKNSAFFINGLTPSSEYYIRISDEEPSTTGNLQMCISKCEISISGSVTDVSCHNGNDGAIDITVSGGTGSLNYDWADISGTDNVKDRTGLIAGTYSVTVTDTPGCEATDEWEVEEPEELSVVLNEENGNTNKQQLSCFGDSDGAIDITVTGGTPNSQGNYTYLWAGPNNYSASTEDISNLVAGPYLVSVTDANECIATGNWIITQPEELSVVLNEENGNTNKQQLSCFGDSDGAIDITVSGGMPNSQGNYTYSWAGPNNYSATTQDISGLTEGTYSVTVTDANGCTKIESFNVIQPNAALSISGTVTHVSCNGGNNGAIDITVSGGTPNSQGNYTYSWAGPNNYSATTQDISGLTEGTYLVTVTDANGCTKDTNFNVSQPNPITADVSSANPTNCNTNDGTITIYNTTGGSNNGYNYKLNNGAWQASNQFNLLAAGTYNVWVRNSALPYCETQIGTVTLISPSSPTATINNTNPNNCVTPSGSIQINGSGGTGFYDYRKDGGQWIEGQPNPYTFTDLSAGTYNLMIRYSDNTCETSLSQQILIDPPSPVITNVNVDNITNCGAKGKVTIFSNIQSGNSQQFALTLSGNSDVWQNSNVFENLSVGNYIPKARNMSAVNCIDTDNAVILSDPPTPVISQAAITQPITQCGGTGQITITSSIQTGYNQQFALTPTGSPTDMWQNSNVFTVSAGTYTPKARNASAPGCIDSFANIQIQNPSLPQAFAIISVSNVCVGSTDVVVTIPPDTINRQLVYNLSGANNNNNQPLTVNINYGVSNFIIPKDKLTNPGSTIITISSIKNLQTNCINTNPLPVITKQFDVFTLPIAQLSLPIDKACKNSPMLLVDGIPSGGSGIYSQHAWSGTGTQYLTNSGIENPQFKTNAEGTFILNYQVVDNRGCTSAVSQPKTIIIHPLPVANPSASAYEVCQKSGEISLNGNPSGGTPSYSHFWKGQGAVKLDNTLSQTPKFNTDADGNYVLQYIVSDINGCKDTSDVVNIKVNPKPEAKYWVRKQGSPAPVQTAILQTGKYYDFNDESISNSNGFSAYNWSFESESPNFCDPLIVQSIEKNVLNVFRKNGNLKVIHHVINDKSCLDTSIITIYKVTDEFSVSIVSNTQNEIYCHGTNYEFSTEIIGGVEPYTYSWKILKNNTEISNSNSDKLQYFFNETGKFTIKLAVTDKNGATANASKDITVAPKPNLKSENEIKDLKICKSDQSINIANLTSYTFSGADKLISLVGNDTIKNNSFIPSEYSGIVTIEYFVNNGGCESDHKFFHIEIKEIEPVEIKILNDDGKYCLGDTLKLQDKAAWDWKNTSGLSDLGKQGQERLFKITSLVNPTLKVEKTENGCVSKAESILTVNKLPDNPGILDHTICKGDSVQIKFHLGIDEVLTFENKTGIDSIFNLKPADDKKYYYRLKNDFTTCYIDGSFNIKVTKVEPIIIPLDSCGTNVGSIFAIKPGSVSNPGNIKWSLKEQSKGNITEGQGTKAIIVGWNDNSLSEIKVQVSEGICTGEGLLIPKSGQKSLTKGDTSLVFERCGSIIFNKDTSCSQYYLGYVDHNTGKYLRINSSKHYFVDTSRLESSERTYFINCSDCSGTDIITYREVIDKYSQPCSGQQTSKVFIVPNPTKGEFELLCEGDYKGELRYEIFNVFGKSIMNGIFNKDEYFESIGLWIDSNAGIYYVRLIDEKNNTKVITVAVAK